MKNLCRFGNSKSKKKFPPSSNVTQCALMDHSIFLHQCINISSADFIHNAAKRKSFRVSEISLSYKNCVMDLQYRILSRSFKGCTRKSISNPDRFRDVLENRIESRSFQGSAKISISYRNRLSFFENIISNRQ